MPYGSPDMDYVLTKKKSGKSMFNLTGIGSTATITYSA